jgi:hypothetical protein
MHRPAASESRQYTNLLNSTTSHNCCTDARALLQLDNIQKVRTVTEKIEAIQTMNQKQDTTVALYLWYHGTHIPPRTNHRTHLAEKSGLTMKNVRVSRSRAVAESASPVLPDHHHWYLALTRTSSYSSAAWSQLRSCAMPRACRSRQLSL